MLQFVTSKKKKKKTISADFSSRCWHSHFMFLNIITINYSHHIIILENFYSQVVWTGILLGWVPGPVESCAWSGRCLKIKLTFVKFHFQKQRKYVDRRKDPTFTHNLSFYMRFCYLICIFKSESNLFSCYYNYIDPSYHQPCHDQSENLCQQIWRHWPLCRYSKKIRSSKMKFDPYPIEIND